MDDQLWQLVGILVTISVPAGGAIIIAFRSVYSAMEAKDDVLHERVNRVRDEYVRRVDLDSHMARLESTLKEMRDEQRGFAKEILTIWNRKKWPD